MMESLAAAIVDNARLLNDSGHSVVIRVSKHYRVHIWRYYGGGVCAVGVSYKKRWFWRDIYHMHISNSIDSKGRMCYTGEQFNETDIFILAHFEKWFVNEHVPMLVERRRNELAAKAEHLRQLDEMYNIVKEL